MRAVEIVEAAGEYLMSPFGNQDIATASEADQIRQVKVSPHSIRYIKNPSERVQMAAVKNDSYAIQHIKNPSERIQLAAVNKNRLAIAWIKNPSEAVQIAAVSEDPVAITYIEHPNKAVQRAGILHSVFTLLYIEVEDIIPIVINQCKREIIKDLLKNISDDSSSYDQLYEVISTLNEFVDWPELAIIKNSLAHEIEKQRAQDREGLDESADEQEQLAAVKQDGYSIQFIKNPSERVQLAAVKKNGNAIRYIENPSERVQLAAIKQSVLAIEFIKNPSEQVQIYSIKNNVQTLPYIENPSLNVLNACKHEIITWILVEIRDGHIRDFSSDEVINKVKNTGWPELLYIKKSLDATSADRKLKHEY